MKLKFSKNNLQKIIYSLLFAGTVFVVFQMFPHSALFNMHYELGKPWGYELLTAPFDFPIYKTDEELAAEKDSLKRFYSPYYVVVSQKLQNQLAKLDYDNTIPSENGVKPYLERTLQNVYEQGIIDAKSYDELNKSNVKEIFLSDSTKIWYKKPLKDLYTVSSACDFICKHAPISYEEMSDLNINRYLIDNLAFDKTKSESALYDLQKNIFPTSGMVQAGERIIDKGEVVKYEQFKMINSLEREYRADANDKNNNLVMLGEILLIAGLLFLFSLYIYLFRPEFISIKNVLFFILMIILIVGSASLTVKYSINVNIVPFALLAFIIRIFFDSRTALFAHIITILIVSLFVPSPYLFLLLHISAGMVAVSSLKQLTHRSQLLKGAVFIFINYSLAYLCFTLIDTGSLGNIHWKQFLYFTENALFLLFLPYILIYIFEKIFGYLSDITLIELSNINNKLLMDFSMKAPGSFQHVMQVSTLAAAAASEINANMLLARTGALYHDIGKIKNPSIFTENQHNGINPLDKKSLEDAAQIIIAHVADGVKIAESYGLPSKIIAFIKSHHAKSVTRYFYNTAINNGEEIDIAKFRYNGQLPSTKEESIVMMADAVEAASHSLKVYNEEIIDTLVETIINTQIADHSFKNAPITFRDVERVKRVLKAKLLNIYHTRISYPELEKK